MKFSRKFAATSTNAKLICVRDEVQEALRLGIIKNPAVIIQARSAIRDIERELVSRWEVSALAVRRRWRKGSR